MSYVVNMHAEKIDCKIPLSDLRFLLEKFQEVHFSGKNVEMALNWEEDSPCIGGTIVGELIHLNEQQQGSFKHSDDGGLKMLLERFRGSGLVNTTGEDGDAELVKYERGMRKKGRIVFD